MTRENKYNRVYRTKSYQTHEDGSISVTMDYYAIIDDLLGGVPHRLAHAVKKILYAGLRLGKKPVQQDVDEAIWSLESYKERLIEEEGFTDDD